MNKLKRFYEPIFEDPKHFWTTFFAQIKFSFYLIFNVFFIKEVIKIFSLGDYESLKKALIIYLIVNLIYFTLAFFTRHWGWAKSYFEHIKKIHKKYLTQFNNLDNTYVENIGTGKFLSIATKGLSTWTDLVLDSIQIPTNLIISIVATFVILSSIGFTYIFIFLVIFF